MENQKQVRLTDEQVARKATHLEELKLQLDRSREAKGFKKLTQKSEEKLGNQIQEKAKELADEFLQRNLELCTIFSMELKPVMRTNPYQPNTAQAVVELKPFKPKVANTKKWHEAMAENLKTRAKCEHVEHAEGGKCEKCALEKYVEINGEPVRAWGESGKGVTQAYLERQRDLIETEKKIQEEADAEDAKAE